jgi:hypothetical protein
VPQTALKEMQEQLRYWQDELRVAEQDVNPERIARCQRYIAQCQHVIAALQDAVRSDPQRDAAQSLPRYPPAMSEAHALLAERSCPSARMRSNTSLFRASLNRLSQRHLRRGLLSRLSRRKKGRQRGGQELLGGNYRRWRNVSSSEVSRP